MEFNIKLLNGETRTVKMDYNKIYKITTFVKGDHEERLRGPNTGYRVRHKGIEYDSYSDAARALGTYVENIRRRVAKGEIEFLGETNE